MHRLGRTDWILLCASLLVWLVCLGLHLKEIGRTGFAEPPIYAAASRTTDAYPTVGGFRMERGHGAEALEVGDRLLRVGEVDLAGAGYFGFDAITFEQAGTAGSVPLLIERRGEKKLLELEMLSSGFPWYRVVPIAAWVLVATLILIRSPGAHSRLLFAATLAVAIFQTQFFGGSRLQTYAALWVFNGLGGIAFILCLRFAIHFPYEVPERVRLSNAWSWIGALFWVVRIPYLIPTPLPSERVPMLVLGSDGLFLIAALGIITYNYRHADPIGRRRVKWMLLGSYLGIAPLGFLALIGVLHPGVENFSALFEAGVMLFVLVPLGALIGILRYNLYDVDRLISVTASYSGLAVVLLAVALTLLPRVAQAASSLLGIESGTGQAALAVLLAMAVVPAQQRLRPQIERIFFRERHAVTAGVGELLDELSGASSPEELVRLAGERLAALLRPECTIIYSRGADNGLYEPVFVRGRAIPPAFEASSLLATTLERRNAPLTSETLTGSHYGVELGPFERAALETLGVPLVLPIRRSEVLIAFICLGPKRSGDVYTSTDVALLLAVADKLSSEVGRFDQTRLLEAGVAMQDSLRRYVPGAVAEQLEAGVDLDTAERDVTILFVDLRGYTSYSEPRAAHEIFSTVNRYTDVVSRVIREFGGTVVEFNGDGMMAVFGAPRALEGKECAAVLAASELGRAVEALSVEAGAVLRVGVGIASGLDFVGNIHAVDRMIWTAIGNTTNLAARLQAMTREFDALLVVDQATFDAARGSAKGWQRHASIPVRGRSEPLDAYSLALAPVAGRDSGATEGA